MLNVCKFVIMRIKMQRKRREILVKLKKENYTRAKTLNAMRKM